MHTMCFRRRLDTDVHVVAQSEHNYCPIGTGRRPEGMVARAPSSETALGSFFAKSSQLEAASVFAFDRLTHELQAHGAPEWLMRDAERSKLDEVRHAVATAHLAKRFGTSTPAISVGSMDVRPLFEIALENAVEGCVREAFGALVAAHQTKHAEDELVARAMAVIAKDEARHAALAWEVAAWAEPRVSEAERERIAEARREAARELRASLRQELAPELIRDAGVPTEERAIAMFDHLAERLWT